MIFYATATLLACLAAWRASRDPQHRLVWMLLSAMPLTLLAAARWGLGTDVDFTYFPVFRALQWVRGGESEELAYELFLPLKQGLRHAWFLRTPFEAALNFRRILGNMEPAYRAILEAVVWCGGDFRWVTVVTSLITSAFVFTAIWRQSRSPVLAIYFYVATSNYFLGLNIVRQYIAIGFVLVAIPFITDRRPWRYLLCIGCAALFHRTALILLPCWLLTFVKIRPIWGFAAVAFAFVTSFVVSDVFRVVLPCLGFGHYVRYFDLHFAEDGFEGFFFAINLCFMALSVWYWDRVNRDCRYFRVWYWMTVLGTVALAYSGFVPLMKRVNFYFAAPQFLMLPELLLSEECPRRRRLLTILAVLAFALETLVAVCLLNKNEPLPYRVKPYWYQREESGAPVPMPPLTWQERFRKIMF